MPIFQFTRQYCEIACNACKVHEYYFLIVWIFHSYFCHFLKESLQIFNCERGIRNFRLPRYYVINIFKFNYICYLLSDWYQNYFELRWLLFCKSSFLRHFRSRRHDVIKLSIADISLIFVRLSHNLVREIWVVHVTLRSYKKSYDLEVHLDLWDQCQGQCIFFHYCLIFRFMPPQILDWVTSNVQLWLLKKGTSGWRGKTSLIYLNWNLSVIYCRFEINFFFGKSRMRMTFIS